MFTEDDDFHFHEVPVSDHPFRLFMPRFALPGILSGAERAESFQLVGYDLYRDEKPDFPTPPGEDTADVQPFSPDVICRAMAKIAHGAAVAEFGIGSFEPYLPDVILGRSPFITYFVGGSRIRRKCRQNIHEISLRLLNGYLVAEVLLFAKLLTRPYLVVVGRPSLELAKWHTSLLMTASAPPA